MRHSLKKSAARVGDIGAMLRASATSVDRQAASIARDRQLVVALCRLLGQRMQRLIPAAGVSKKSLVSDGAACPPPHLSPRLRQTLDLLLEGASEKQVARRLAISQHTVHVYVKSLYRLFAVSSRAELLGKFIPPVVESISRTALRSPG